MIERIAFILFCIAGSSVAIEKTKVDRIITPAVDGKWCDAVAVGIIEDSATQTFNYGPVTADTIFEIGSATKVFTSLALAEMVVEKSVALDDPIDKYLPAGSAAPKYKDKSITLLDLATHRSGLPRLPDNLDPKNPSDPYADYDSKRLLDFLSHHKLARAPGEKYEYSNLGAGLLGYLLADHAKKSYEQLITERITDPLNMLSTYITARDFAQVARAVAGHDADGDSQPDWHFDALAGAGAIRSTVNDLLKFLAANISPPPGNLGDAIKLSHQRRAKTEPGNDIGLAWHIGTVYKEIWHSGETAGFHSYIAFVPAKKIGVVVLTNTAIGVGDQLGALLVRQLLGEQVDPPKLRQTAKIDPKVLDDYVGDYALGPLFKITITRKDNQLLAQATGQAAAKIYPESDTKFFYKIVDAQLTFERGKDGKIARLVLDQNGQHLSGKRVK
jgi:serine-type D-Ala-D-Ala carboxypeptidase/endopeptidase